MPNKFDWESFDEAPSAQPSAKGSEKFDWNQFEEESPPKPGIFDGAVKRTIDSLPMIGGVVGGVLGTPADAVAGPMGNVVGAGIGGYIGTATKNLINKYYDPENAPKTETDVITQPLSNGASQAAAQATGEFAAPYVAKAVNYVSKPISEALSNYAAKKAVNATGATGAQAAKFSPEAGQELLDRGIVKFGDSQKAVSKKATDALDQAGKNIGDALTSLDKRGASVDHNEVISSLRKRASELSKDPSQFGVSDQLSGLADRIQQMVEASGGESKIPLSVAEKYKRGFQESANYNSSPLDLTKAKEAASIYRQAVEDAASKLDPEVAKLFKSQKEDYKLLSPIQEAAEKRAATLSQSPHGGLLDTAAIIAGEGAGGAPGAILAPMARRAISTRIPSTLAATANAAKGLAQRSPLLAEGASRLATQVPLVGSAASEAIPQGAMVLPAAAQNESKRSNRAPAKGYAEGGPVINPDKAKALQGGFFGALGGGKPPTPPKQDPPQNTSNYAYGGGPVPGRAKVAGNSSRNDTVHAMLSPGEIVLPRSVIQAKNAPEAAAKFVADHLKKAKGQDAWAKSGAEKLGLHPTLAAQLLQSPKGKQLLVQASDLKPGSKALQRINDQIMKGYGKR